MESVVRSTERRRRFDGAGVGAWCGIRWDALDGGRAVDGCGEIVVTEGAVVVVERVGVDPFVAGVARPSSPPPLPPGPPGAAASSLARFIL